MSTQVIRNTPAEMTLRVLTLAVPTPPVFGLEEIEPQSAERVSLSW